MARAFQREVAGESPRYVTLLDPGEVDVVAWLLRQTAELVAPPEVEATGDAFADLMAQVGAPVEDGPRDSALRRIVPAGHREDPEAAAAYRAWTERTLRSTKAQRLSDLADLLESVEPDRQAVVSIALTEEEGASLAAALTDVRLLLADRIGLHTEADAQAIHAMIEAADAAAAEAGEFDEAGADDDLIDDSEDLRSPGDGDGAADTYGPGDLGPLHAYYSFMTWWQETLSEALLDDLPH